MTHPSDNMRRAYQHLASTFAGAPLTLSQTALMRALLEKGPQNQTQLTDATGIDRSTLSEMLRRLATMGFVVAVRTQEDKRANMVVMAPAGRKALWKAEEALSVAEAKMVRQVAPDDRKPFLRALRALAEARPGA